MNVIPEPMASRETFLLWHSTIVVAIRLWTVLTSTVVLCREERKTTALSLRNQINCVRDKPTSPASGGPTEAALAKPT
jgi:hypothetical protein